MCSECEIFQIAGKKNPALSKICKSVVDTNVRLSNSDSKATWGVCPARAAGGADVQLTWSWVWVRGSKRSTNKVAQFCFWPGHQENNLSQPQEPWESLVLGGGDCLTCGSPPSRKGITTALFQRQWGSRSSGPTESLGLIFLRAFLTSAHTLSD